MYCFTALYICFDLFLLVLNLFVSLLVFCIIKGAKVGLNQFFSRLVLKLGFLLSGLKTYNYGTYWANLCCFVPSFVYVFVSYVMICTILPFVITSSEVLFLLFRSIFVCSMCKFMRELC